MSYLAARGGQRKEKQDRNGICSFFFFFFLLLLFILYIYILFSFCLASLHTMFQEKEKNKIKKRNSLGFDTVATDHILAH